MDQENKIESLKEILKVYEANELITNFSILNEFIKQSILYISIKKSKLEKISTEDKNIFEEKYEKLKNIIDKIITQ